VSGRAGLGMGSWALRRIGPFRAQRARSPYTILSPRYWDELRATFKVSFVKKETPSWYANSSKSQKLSSMLSRRMRYWVRLGMVRSNTSLSFTRRQAGLLRRVGTKEISAAPLSSCRLLRIIINATGLGNSSLILVIMGLSM